MAATINRAMKILGAGALAIAIAGCSSILAPQPDRTKFYVLTPVPESATPAQNGAPNGRVIGLGPVKLPAYLDRPEIVTRAAPNRIELSKIDRWAEPLHGNFVQVLSRDLSARLGAGRIVRFPWYSTTPIDLQVRLEVYRFETGAQGTAHLTAGWTLVNGAGTTVLYNGQSDISENAKAGDATEAAAALSRAVNVLSGQIAAQAARQPAK
ncbi:MAG: PqiC family protein [Candidatus Binataceae bacterium]